MCCVAFLLACVSALSLAVSRPRISGLSNSWLLVGSIGALFTTPYGLLLLFKLTLFALLLGLGARNRLMIKTAPGPKAIRCSDLLSQLRRNVICEICLGLLLVAIVGWLGITPPARHQLIRQTMKTSSMPAVSSTLVRDAGG